MSTTTTGIDFHYVTKVEELYRKLPGAWVREIVATDESGHQLHLRLYTHTDDRRSLESMLTITKE